MKKFLIVTYCLLFAFYELHSQNLPYYYSANNIKVLSENGKALLFPFTGGLKHPLFGMLDLNADGYNDLIVLDRMDDRILTFRNSGIKDSFGFIYRPQYELFLPDSLSSTLVIKDFNKDGKPDLLVFDNINGAGFMAYKNVSSSFHIKFELVANPIKSIYFDTTESDIYITSLDIPAIEDIDGDGDMDILTFGIIPGYVEYHKNMSQELYHNSDSLKFRLATDCWGNFMEGDLNNHIILNTDTTICQLDHISHIISERTNDSLLSSSYRHAGSTFMANDMDNDGDVDVVLGDSGYPGLILLTNGKKELKHIRDKIISYDTIFPRSTKPVQVKQMPGVFYLDLDNDSIKDMLVSPMDMSQTDGLHQIWLYKNTGTNNNPKFNFIKNDFLQDEMIDLGGATQPVFFDYDQDGDYDLFVVTTGNYTETLNTHDRIVLYENTGNARKAEFRFKSNDFMNLSLKNYQSLTLTFGDIDGDHKSDMILGKRNGTLTYYKNITSGSDTARFQFVTDYLNSIDVGDYSAPFVYDIDNNNYADLFVGTDLGEISYYSNIGKNNIPDFKFITPSFGGISFTDDQHYMTPVICDLNKNGKPDLVFSHNYYVHKFGIVIGDIGYIEDIDADTSHKYQPIYNRIKDPSTQQLVTRQPGKILRPAFSDLDGDGSPDMMLGSSRGGLMLLTTKRDTVNLGLDEQLQRRNYSIPIYPNPAHTVLNIDLTELNGYSRLNINDLTGKTVINKIINNGSQFQLDISSLQPGFYIIRIQDIQSEYYYFKKSDYLLIPVQPFSAIMYQY